METKKRCINHPTFVVLKYLTHTEHAFLQWMAEARGLEASCAAAPEVLNGSTTTQGLMIETLAKRQQQAVAASCSSVDETFCKELLATLVEEIDWHTVAEFIVGAAKCNAADWAPAFVQGKAKFFTDKITVTRGAATMLDSQEIGQAIARHLEGDWGDLPYEDRADNERALSSGGRLMSAFGDDGKRVWVITEADRSVTTVLLPEEY